MRIALFRSDNLQQIFDVNGRVMLTFLDRVHYVHKH
jgi:hypothetical protein